jgi:integrase
MRALLTDKLLKSATAKVAPVDLWDTRLPGLVFRVRPSGAASFSAVARRKGHGTAPIRVSLRPGYPALSLAEARERAAPVLRALADGRDPRLEQAELVRAETVAAASTFDAVAAEYIRRVLAHKRSGRILEQRIVNKLLPAWGSRPITSITRFDVVTLTDSLVDAGEPESARETLGLATRIFRWAVLRGVLEASPVGDLRASDLIAGKRSRARTPGAPELALILRAARRLGYPDGVFVQLLLFTGMRRSEVARMTWAELDAGLWTIPGTRMKNAKPFTLPLAPVVVELLSAVPRVAGSSHVLISNGAGSFTSFSRGKARLDATIRELNGGTPLEEWSWHDLRRSYRSGLSMLGIPPHVAEFALSHQPRGLVAVYDRYAWIEERRHAAGAWAHYLLGLVDPTQARVVKLSRKAAQSA